MRFFRQFLISLAFACLPLGSVADPMPVNVGGDSYIAGPSVTERDPAGRDLLAMGLDLDLGGDVADDVHAIGFDVAVDGSVGGDVVAAGASVLVDAMVTGDVTASGVTVRTAPDAQIDGNARLAGATVTIEGAVSGAVVAAGADVELNAVVVGDVALTGARIRFGPDARIEGTLTYTTDDAMDVPAQVISAERVTFRPAEGDEMWDDIRSGWSEWDSPVQLTPWRVVGGFLVNLGLFIVVGAIFLSLAPGTVRRLRRSADARPGMVILTGAIGLSILFGAVPIAMLSVVGLPVVPLLVLLILVTWLLGYLLGAYILAMAAMRGFGGAESPTIFMRLLALAIGVTIVALLNFIPVIGWMANFALVLLGVGAITTVLFDTFLGRLEPELDQGLAPLAPPDT